MPSVEELEAQLKHAPVPVTQVEAELAAPSPAPSWFTPRLRFADLTGPPGQSALAAGLAMTPIAGIPGFLAGAGGALLAEEGTRRLQEQLGPVPGFLVGTGLSALAGGKVGVMGEVPPMRQPPVLAMERGGKVEPPAFMESPSLKPMEPPMTVQEPPVSPAAPIKAMPEETPESALFATRASREINKKLSDLGKAYFAEKPEHYIPGMTVTNNIVYRALRGDIPMDVLQQSGLTKEDFLPFVTHSMSESARSMAYQSQIAKMMNLSNEEMAALKEAGSAIDEATVVRPLWKQLDDLRRGLLVSQLSTAMRNFETQIGRVGLDVLQAPLDAGIQKIAGVAAKTSPLDGLEELMTIFQRGTKGQVEKILEHFPAQKDRLLMTYSSDLARPAGAVQGAMKYAEQAVDLANWANRFQEYVVRRGVFQAKLAQELRSKGLDLNEMIGTKTVGAMPEDAVKNAVDHALTVTFAETPKYGTAAKAFVDAVNKLPGATLPIPFPRFMVNSFKFLFDYNPTGILNYLSPAERTAFANGDVSKISKATIGTGLLLTAYQLRNSEYAGEKWYEVKGPNGTTVDLRPFNPFAAHLFIADVAKRAHEGTLDTLTAKDIAMGLLSTNLRAGVGLYTLDKALEGITSYGDSEGAVRGIRELAGQTAAGVLTPLRQIIDVLGEFDQEYRKLRDVRQEPFTGPIKANVPGLAPTLPEAAVPTRAGAPERVHPLMRQLTGMAMSQKTPVEHELDRLGFTRQQLLPSTGDPAIDRVRALTMGPLMERGAGSLVLSPDYLDLNDHEKAFVLESVIKELRRPANAAGLAAMEPKQLIQERLKTMPTRKRRMVEDKLTR